MKYVSLCVSVAVVVSVGLGVASTQASSASNLPLPENRSALLKPDNAQRSKIAEQYGKLPLAFEENKGQTDAKVKFFARGLGYSLFLTSDEAVFGLSQKKAGIDSRTTKNTGEMEMSVLRAKLVGANEQAVVSGEAPLEGVSNYISGPDQNKWHTGVKQYGRVRYSGVYSGIDLVYYGNQRELEYDFIVAPGANPKNIRIAYNGAEKLSVAPNGELLIKTSAGVLKQRKPVIYQIVDDKRKKIDGGFVLNEKQQVAFEVAAYDPSLPLTIDPQLGYSTFLGGTHYDIGKAIVVDRNGNAYVTGETYSSDFPIVKGIPKPAGAVGAVFVAKINAIGNAFAYTTYISGTYSVGTIAVDNNGSAYIGGLATPFFPATPGAYQTTMTTTGPGISLKPFIAKLSPAGNSLVYATYFDSGLFALGADGSAYVAVSAGIKKLNPQGNAVLHSFPCCQYGNIFSIAADSAGNVYVSGETLSPQNFVPTAGALFPTPISSYSVAFFAKINFSGNQLLYSSFFPVSTAPSEIAVDSQGNVYLAGSTGTVIPTTPGAFQSSKFGYSTGYVAKINKTGNALLYLTYLGGEGDSTTLNGLAVDTSGNAYVAGYTFSSHFPTTSNAIQPKYAGGVTDAFISKLNSTGTALIYSTYLGGNLGIASTEDPSVQEPQDDGPGLDEATAIAVDACGSAYVTGFTRSINFPITLFAPQLITGNNAISALGLHADAFVTKILSSDGILPVLPLNLGASNLGVKC